MKLSVPYYLLLLALCLQLTANSNTLQAQNKGEKKAETKQAKVSLLYQFYRKIFPTEEQKAIKEALEKGIRPRLRQEGVAMLEVPTALKTVIGELYLACKGSSDVSYECDCSQIENPEKAYIELKGAYELLNQYQLSKSDLALMIEIGEFLAKQTGNENYKGRRGYKTWLYENYTRLEGCFGDKIKKTQIEIDTLNQRKFEIQAEIDRLKDRSTGITTQIEEIDQTLDELGKEKREVNLQVNASLSNYKKVVRQLEDMIPSNDPIWSSDLIEGTDDGVRLVRSNTEVDPTWTPNIKEYRLGDHCGSQIREATQAIINAMIKQRYADLHNPRAIDDIKIKLVIRGKADGTKIRRCINYYGDDIRATYFPVEYGFVSRNDARKVDLRNGRCDVDNSVLAFLRAYCAYNQIIEIFEENDLLQFFYEEGREAGDVEFQSEAFLEEGTEFRGVDINIIIEGLYQHKEREKGELAKRKVELEREEGEIEEQRQVYEREKKIIDAQIQKLEKLKRYYAEKLLDPEVVQEDVDKIIKNIELYQTLTPQTKKVVRDGTVSIGKIYKYILLSKADQKLVRTGKKSIDEFE